ncbi:aromatic prenyltransferase [Streptomyces sp. NBC_01506]|uniref:aromatic prenyltransferase n=1 Tax=Streptomyces sp. NBC_01506 TaxID=2903887 RepID=UPI00386EB5BC
MSGGIEAEELYAALEKSAHLVGAPFSREKVWPILSAYRDGFDTGGAILSLQAGERAEEVEYSVQVSPGVGDPYARALAGGFVPETDHPVATLLQDIKERVPTSEYYIDCGIVGGFKKIYANFPHDPRRVSDLSDIASMPPAVAGNSDFFGRYGLQDVVLIGVDYRRRTMNLYFQLPAGTAGDLDPKTVLAMLRETGMREPDEDLLAYAGKAYRVYATVGWDSPEIRRISFAPSPRRSLDLSELPARLEPGFEEFMRNTAHTYDGELINASAAKWSPDSEFLDLAAYYQISPQHLKALTAAEAQG